MVVTPEPTSITDAYGLIKVIANYNVHPRVDIVINRVLNKQEADITIDKLKLTASHFLPHMVINPLGSVRDDKSVVQAVKAQVPFVLHNPAGKAAQAVTEMANQLLGVEEKGHKTGGFTKFLNRLTKIFG